MASVSAAIVVRIPHPLTVLYHRFGMTRNRRESGDDASRGQFRTSTVDVVIGALAELAWRRRRR
jgi:hypothetical protein